MTALLKELKDRFGEKEGARIFNTITPGIVGDFNKMLKAAGVDKRISEEYRLEDGSGVIVVTGNRNAKGEVDIEAHFR